MFFGVQAPIAEPNNAGLKVRPHLYVKLEKGTQLYNEHSLSGDLGLWFTQVNADGSIPMAFVYGKEAVNQSWGGVTTAFTKQVRVKTLCKLQLQTLFKTWIQTED